MRASSSLLALLAASVAPLIQASTFEFTGPDTNAPLNLSASSINITWTLDRGDNPGDWKARHINLNYISETSDGTGISYAIGTNISLPDGDGSYSWNPASVLEGLNKSENGNLWVSSGKKHYFTASTEPAGTTTLRSAPRPSSPSTVRSLATAPPDLRRQTITLPDGRLLGFAEYGDPQGRPLLYFHGYPSSRLEASAADDLARQRNIRLLALDRPGFGLSSPQPGRQILDWPVDVAAFAKDKNLDRFAVMGLSGGGPYALACAKALPREMLTGVGLFASGLVSTTRWVLGTNMAQKRIDAWLEGERKKAKDEAKTPKSKPERPVSEARDDLLRMLIGEPFAQGSEAAVYEAKLLSSDSWGFDFERVDYDKVQIWHGAKDKNAPIALIRYMAERLPYCRLTELKDDSHYTMFQHVAGALDDLVPAKEVNPSSET
ncbi:hypothetical protein ACHAQA_003083 [Verticillium albo-atrum]